MQPPWMLRVIDLAASVGGEVNRLDLLSTADNRGEKVLSNVEKYRQ